MNTGGRFTTEAQHTLTRPIDGEELAKVYGELKPAAQPRAPRAQPTDAGNAAAGAFRPSLSNS